MGYHKYNDDEVQAHRAALQTYTNALVERLGDDGLVAMTSTSHVHKALINIGEKVLPIVITVEFGPMTDVDELRELIDAATNNPGGIPEA